MAVKYRGKRLKLVRAPGFRLGIGYLPHWKTNPNTSTPRQLIVWCGPWFITWSLKKRGWEPRPWYSNERYVEIMSFVDNQEEELSAIREYWYSRDVFL